MSAATVLTGLLTIFAALTVADSWLIYRHSNHRHARHRLHRAAPYPDRIHHLIATRSHR